MECSSPAINKHERCRNTKYKPCATDYLPTPYTVKTKLPREANQLYAWSYDIVDIYEAKILSQVGISFVNLQQSNDE